MRYGSMVSYREFTNETKNSVITPETKDEVLSIIKGKLLTSSVREVSIEYSDATKLDISKGDFEAIIGLFVRIGLVSQNRGFGRVTVNAEFDDFVLKGGFVAQYDLFKSELERLKTELEVLSKSLDSDKINKVNSVIELTNNIIKCLTWAGSITL